jgi:two-component system, NarL family, sensor histidine kinase UhpB
LASPSRSSAILRPQDAQKAADIRHALARELHDRVAQTLTSMLVELEHFKLDQKGNHSVVNEVNGLQDSTREVLNNLRSVLYDLRGIEAAEEGFVDTVGNILKRFQDRTRITAILSVAPSWPVRLGRSAALNILRIIEEALSNVRLHSGANLVEVMLGGGDDSTAVVVEVRDNGRGTETDVTARAPGLGMVGMRERALILGGRLEILAATGGGTCVRAIFPKEQLN